MNVVETKDGVVVEVYVKPRAGDFKIKIEGDTIVVSCREEPLRGRVNKELVKEFSKLFHRRIELVSGFTSKQKRLLIREITKDEVQRVLLNK